MIAQAMREGLPYIPIARPDLGAEEEAAAARAIRSGWVVQGPEVAAFESEVASVVGAPHACALSSGTAALHLALRAVGVQAGDEVATVSHSYIATANAVRYCGARPVFVDIDPLTFNMDPARLEWALGPRTRAILCVHQIGMPCDLEAILAVARRHRLPVVEDAACALGSEVQRDGGWQRIGRPHGDVACFSFHPRKAVTTGDGGLLTTARPEWDAQFRLWRQHGMSAGTEAGTETYPTLGYNYRLTDIQAAVGRAQLRRLDGMLERRRQLVERYRDLLAELPGLGLPTEPAGARTNWQSYCVRLPPGSDQRAVMRHMQAAGVATRRGVMCAHREPAYGAGTWTCTPGTESCPEPGGCTRLRHSEEAQDQGVMLPLFSQLTDDDQVRVAQGLRGALSSPLP